MRVVISTTPGHGHFAPLIPLAAAIRAQGHEAVFATSESARAGLAVHGLALEPCGPHWRESDFGRSAAPYHALADLPPFLETEVEPRMLFDLDTAVRRRRPDVILSDDFEPVGEAALCAAVATGASVAVAEPTLA